MAAPQPGGWQPAAPPPRPKLAGTWYVWLVLVTGVLSCCLGQLGPQVIARFGADSSDGGASGALSGDPAKAPSDPCALITKDALALAVPSPKVKRSEADNTYEHTKYGHCDVETDGDAATSTARASLYLDIERRGEFIGMTPEENARSNFAGTKAYNLKDERVYDLAGVGDAAYFTAESLGKGHIAILLYVLAGPDTIKVHYISSPTDTELAAGAAVVLARSVVKGLKR